MKLLPNVVFSAVLLIPGLTAGLLLSRPGMAMFAVLLGAAPLLFVVVESLFLTGRPLPPGELPARGAPYREPAPGSPIAAPRKIVRPVFSHRHLLRPRFLAASTLLACLPGLALCASYSVQRWPDAATWSLPFLPAVPILAFAALLRLYLFLCPRCRDLFFLKMWLPPAALPDVLRIWHCPHCHVRTGIPGGRT